MPHVLDFHLIAPHLYIPISVLVNYTCVTNLKPSGLNNNDLLHIVMQVGRVFLCWFRVFAHAGGLSELGGSKWPHSYI